MTITEMTAALNSIVDEHGDRLYFAGDYADRFGISNDEAARIADRATSVQEFISIWENDDWWLDQAE